MSLAFKKLMASGRWFGKSETPTTLRCSNDWQDKSYAGLPVGAPRGIPQPHCSSMNQCGCKPHLRRLQARPVAVGKVTGEDGAIFVIGDGGAGLVG